MSFRTKKRKKATRFRGYRSHSRGFKKKARGSGHRGGVGMAGTGKRGDARKTLILNLFGNDYFGKDKALRRGNYPKKLQVVDIQRISENISLLVKQGVAKDNKGSYDLDLKGYKILGNGDIKIKVNITASRASQSAQEKVKKAGGEIILPEVKEVKSAKTERKEEKKEVKTSKNAK